jgi:hypothetical protein
MELLGSIILYSSNTWKLKVKLSFIVFDFDKSKSISKDEMVIMVISFIKGIEFMTSTHIYDNFDLEALGKQFFELAFHNPSKLITLKELEKWVESSPSIISLFMKYENNKIPKLNLKKQDRKSIADHPKKFDRFYTTSRRPSKFRALSLPHSSERTDRNKHLDDKNLHEIFFRNVNKSGYATAGTLYQSLLQNPRFSKDSEFFFHEFNFDPYKEINFSQLVAYFDKAKSKNGYFIKKGKDVIYPKNNDPDYSQLRYSLNMLKTMFKKFDKNEEGLLSPKEFRELAGNFLSDINAAEVFKEFDKKKFVDFSDFLTIFSARYSVFIDIRSPD